MGKRRGVSAVNVVFGWVRQQSNKVKIALGIIMSLILVVFLKLTVKNHNHFFIASELIHAAGIIILIYKLTRQKTCSGNNHYSNFCFVVIIVLGNSESRNVNVYVIY